MDWELIWSILVLWFACLMFDIALWVTWPKFDPVFEVWMRVQRLWIERIKK